MASNMNKAMIGAVLACTLAAGAGLVGCSGGSQPATYEDGTYTAQSSVQDANVDGDGYVEVTLTVQDGAISKVDYVAYQVDGTPKDADYGKDGAYYALAQKAVSAGDDYATALLESGTVDGIDVVSGATFLYDQFVEAAQLALDQASE